MEEQFREERELEINLQEVFYIILRKLWLIILLGILGAIVTFVCTKTFFTPIYQSTTKIYVLDKEKNTSVSYTDLQLSSQIIEDYAELIKSRTVLESVIVANNLETDYKTLSENVFVSIPENTHIIAISVTDEDPYTASELANKIRDAAAEHIKNVMDVQAINTVDEADIPTSPVKPNIWKNSALGALLAMIVVVAVLIVIYMLNDTVKTPEDVERYLGLSVLGSVPLENVNKKKNYKKKRKSKSKEGDN